MTEKLQAELSLTDKLTPKLLGVTRLMTVSEETSKKLSKSIAGVEKSFSSASAFAKAYGKSIDKLTKSFGVLGKKQKDGGETSKKAGKEGEHSLFGIGVAVELAHKAFEKLEGAFDAVAEHAKELREINETAEMRGGEEGKKTIVELEKQLTKMGVSAKKVDLSALVTTFKPADAARLAKNITDIQARVRTLDTEEGGKKLSMMFQKLGTQTIPITSKQVQTFGRISGLTYEQIVAGIAKTKNVSIASADAQLKAHQLTARDLIKGQEQAALSLEGTAKAGDFAADKNAKSFDHMSDRVKLSLLDLGSKVVEAFRTDKAASSFGKLADKIDSIANNPKFLKFISDVADVLGTVLSTSIDIAVASVSGLVGAFQWLTSGSEKANAVLALLAGAGVAALAIALVAIVPPLVASGIAAAGAAIGFIAASLPIIAIIAGVALLALGLYELIAHWDDVTDWFKKGGAVIADFVADTWNSVVGFVSKFADAGKNLVIGLADGILSAALFPAKAIVQVGKAAIDGFKGIMGIHSPSKVMMEMGVNTTEGFTQGVEQGSPQAVGAVQGIATGSVAEASSGGSSGGGNGSVVVHFGDINIGHGGDKNNSQSGAELGADFIRHVRREIIDIVSGAQAQGA